MKKKLFENIGGNKFKMKEFTSNPLEDAILAMTPEQRNDDAEIFKAMDVFFEKFGQNARTISTARNALEYNDIDVGLVDEYLTNNAGGDKNPNDSDQL